MPRTSALRVAVLTDVNFTDRARGESSLHAAQLIQQFLNEFFVSPEGLGKKIKKMDSINQCEEVKI